MMRTQKKIPPPALSYFFCSLFLLILFLLVLEFANMSRILPHYNTAHHGVIGVITISLTIAPLPLFIVCRVLIYPSPSPWRLSLPPPLACCYWLVTCYAHFRAPVLFRTILGFQVVLNVVLSFSYLDMR